MKTCTQEGCDRRLAARGLCNLHYMKWVRSTEAYKISQKNYERSNKGRERSRRYYKSDTKKSTRKTWLQTPAGRAYKKRRRQIDSKSPGGIRRKFESCVRRRNHLRQRTPKWANIAAIKEFYKNRPEGYHVDHIIPLKGKEVSGLHVLDNLQYLKSEDNIKKSADFLMRLDSSA